MADHWEFTHVLVYQFARDEGAPGGNSIGALCEWVARHARDILVRSKLGEDCAAIQLALRHSSALLGETEHPVLVERLANAQLYELLDRLYAFGRLDLVESAVLPVIAFLRSAVRETGTPGARERELAVAHRCLGDLRAAQGRLRSALASYRESETIRRWLAQADPDNAGWQRDLSFSLTRIAKVHEREGSAQDALPYAEESLTIDERLAALDPTNASWGRDVEVSRALVARLQPPG